MMTSASTAASAKRSVQWAILSSVTFRNGKMTAAVRVVSAAIIIVLSTPLIMDGLPAGADNTITSLRKEGRRLTLRLQAPVQEGMEPLRRRQAAGEGMAQHLLLGLRQQEQPDHEGC